MRRIVQHCLAEFARLLILQKQYYNARPLELQGGHSGTRSCFLPRQFLGCCTVYTTKFAEGSLSTTQRTFLLSVCSGEWLCMSPCIRCAICRSLFLLRWWLPLDS